jgi:hypothetical protein
MQKTPTRRHVAAQGAPDRSPKAYKAARRFAGQCVIRIWMTSQNRNCGEPKNPGPAVPAVDLPQIVRPHQPNEATPGKTPAECVQGFGSITGAELRLQIGDPDPRMTGQPRRTGQARGPGRHAVRRLQRVLRTDQPPHLVEGQGLHRLKTGVTMPLMRRVERSAQ